MYGDLKAHHPPTTLGKSSGERRHKWAVHRRTGAMSEQHGGSGVLGGVDQPWGRLRGCKVMGQFWRMRRQSNLLALHHQLKQEYVMQSQYFSAESVGYASQDADQMTGKTDIREFFSIKMVASHAQSTFMMKPHD